MAGSILTIWLAEVARLFVEDAARLFLALLGAFFGAGFWQEVHFLNLTFVILTIERNVYQCSQTVPAVGRHIQACVVMVTGLSLLNMFRLR